MMEVANSTSVSGYDNQGLDMTLEDQHTAVDARTGRSTDFVVPFSNVEASCPQTEVTIEPLPTPTETVKKPTRIFVKGLSLPSIGCVEPKLPPIETSVRKPTTTDLRLAFPATGSAELKRLLASQQTMAAVLADINSRQKLTHFKQTDGQSVLTRPFIPGSQYSPLGAYNSINKSDIKSQCNEAPEYTQVTVNPCYSPNNNFALPAYDATITPCDVTAGKSFLQLGEMRPRAWTFSNDRPQKHWNAEKTDTSEINATKCRAMNPIDKTLQRSCSLQSIRSSTLSGYDDKTCRICWLDDSAGELIQPCFCAGSSAYVHQQCLQHWLNVSNAHSCEICQYQFKTIRKMKPVSQWRWRPGKSRQLAQLEATMILLAIVTPPLLCGIILCSQKIADYFKEPGHAWKMAGLMTLVFISVSTYAGAVFYFGRKFAIVCKSWVNSNRTMTVALSDEPIYNPAIKKQPETPEITGQPNSDLACPTAPPSANFTHPTAPPRSAVIAYPTAPPATPGSPPVLSGNAPLEAGSLQPAQEYDLQIWTVS